MTAEFEIFDHPVLDEQQMADLKIQPGEYPFETVEAKGMISKNGNKMILLTMRVWDNNNKIHTMTDFLVSMDTMSYKIKHFWESVGFPDRYNIANRVFDYTNRQGYCKIAPQKNKLNGLTENKIVDYVLKTGEKTEKFNALNTEIKDDEIPF